MVRCFKRYTLIVVDSWHQHWLRSREGGLTMGSWALMKVRIFDLELVTTSSGNSLIFGLQVRSCALEMAVTHHRRQTDAKLMLQVAMSCKFLCYMVDTSGLNDTSHLLWQNANKMGGGLHETYLARYVVKRKHVD